MYAHLAEPSPLQTGETVRTGQPIGIVGDTGDATACHLHFEIWGATRLVRGRQPVRPAPLPRKVGRLQLSWRARRRADASEQRSQRPRRTTSCSVTSKLIALGEPRRSPAPARGPRRGPCGRSRGRSRDGGGGRRVDPLVAGGAAADLDPLHQAQLLELLERPVDAGPADRRPAAAQLVVEVEGGDRAVVAGQRLDHRGAGAAAAVARPPAGSPARARPSRCRSRSAISADRSLRRAAAAGARSARSRPTGSESR